MPTEQLPGLEQALQSTEVERRSEPSPLVEPIEAERPREHAQRAEMLRIIAEEAGADEQDFGDALVELEKALAEHPEDAFALATKARILWACGQREDAISHVRKAVALNPRLDWALAELGDWLCELERAAEADTLFERLLDADGDNAVTLGIYGRLLRRTGRLKKATSCLEKAVAEAPALAWTHAQLGEALWLQGRSRRALGNFQESERLAEEKALGPNVVAWILTRQGLALTSARRYELAIQRLTRALSLSPDNPGGVRLKAHALWESGQRETCFQFLKGVIIDAAQPSWAYIELAHYAERMGLYEEALAVVDECLDAAPESGELLTRKGVLLHRIGQFEDSARILAEAATRCGKSWFLLGQRASALKYLGADYHDEALATVQEALELTDSEPMLWSTRGDLLRAQGRLEAARKDYGRCVELLDARVKEHPQSVDAPTMWLMGWSSLWLGEDDLAFRLLAHAKSLKPDLYMIRFVLALALFARGQVRQARSELDAALGVIADTSPLLQVGMLRASAYAFEVAVGDASSDVHPETRVGLQKIKAALKTAEKKRARSEVRRETLLPTPAERSEHEPVPGPPQSAQPAGPLDLSARPTADPMMPMIRLDGHFRIVEWNAAADLAFDHTLDGRRDQWIGDWITKHLDDPLAAAEHGKKVFLRDPANPPLVDRENQHYTSTRYGPIRMIKRAYYVPNDDNETQLGWLLIFELQFERRSSSLTFRKDLIRELREEIQWTEHALSYDAVLSDSKVYQELLDTMIGQLGPLSEVPARARILDLGCGTGNLTQKLLNEPGEARRIYALDNNNAMLRIVREKCAALRAAGKECDVKILKQDISRLSALRHLNPDGFDLAFAINVLNTVPDAAETLRQIHAVLRDGGELRVSGPRIDSDVDVLFTAIRRDLESRNLFAELQPFFEHIYELNVAALKPTFQWTVDQLADMLLEAGFAKITSRGEGIDVFAGQSMVVCAQK